MSHIDEGAFHAYLDGALDEYPAAEAQHVREHLEVCAVCRERLEAEREIRENAASILGLAAPEVTVPSFEELRAYVRANTPRRGSVSVRIYRMGWAASIVLALGTGWMLRGGQIPVTSATGVSIEQAPTIEAPASFDAAESDVAELERSVESVPAATTDEVTQEAQVTPPPAAREVARQEVAAVPSAADRIQSAGTTPSAGSSPSASATPTEPADAPAPVDVLADLDVVAALPSGVRLDEEVMPAAASGAGTDQSVALPPQEPASTTADPLAEREVEQATDGAGVQGGLEPERRSGSDDLVTSANVAAPTLGLAARRRSVEFGDARDDLGDEEESYSLVVPNLEVIDVLFRGSGVRTEGQVVRQRLESGDTLEVIHLPPELDPSVIEEPGPGDTELVVQRAAGWIVMRAPVGEEDLLELLERLLAER